MQCHSCQFENIPGTESCGRCGATLRLSAMSVGVHPPRASRWQKRQRTWLAAAGRLCSPPRFLDAFARRLLSPAQVERSTSGIVWRMAIPGWPQRYCGQRTRGAVFLGSYLATLLAGLFLAGTTAGSVLIGLALGIHASSVLDIVFTGTPALWDRLGRSLLCLLLLAVVVYVPAGWLLGRFAAWRTIAIAIPPFQAGDVILFSRAAYYFSDPEEGDVVYYRIPAARVNSRTPDGQAAVYVLGGERIDRVLAGPGQEVLWKDQQLWVDGRQASWQPLNPAALPEQLALTVPDGAYCILPSTDPLVDRLRPDVVERYMAIVPVENILGRVVARSQPLSRFWMIR